MSVLLPILLFGVLVFIHELGHFSVAKLSGVYVERFALGFGPAIFRKTWGETEYAICLLPLGGYVKMRGEDLDEAGQTAQPDPRSFAQKPVWTRIAIVAMGPISNLILPIVLFTILFMVGMNVPTATIGSLIPGYPAEQAGLRPGDKVLTVQDKPVSTWSQLTAALSKRGGEETQLSIIREGNPMTITVKPVSEQGMNAYGEQLQVGKIGIDPVPYLPVVGVPSSDSVAAKLGIKTGDVITSINGTPIKFWWAFENAFSASTAEKTLTVKRLEAEKETTLTFVLPAELKTFQQAGIEDGSQYVREVKEGSIAAEKGLLAGDKVVSINATPIASWHEFRSKINESTGESLTIGVIRAGKPLTFDLIPQEVVRKDEITQEKQKHRQLGVISSSMPGDPAMFLERHLNPLKAMFRGVQETVDITSTTLVGLGKLVSGKLSVNTLGGPISIFHIAGTSYKMGGWEAFFRIMAILSITLAVLNFLPIPVLDGGHLFFFLIEAIKGSPVSLKIQRVGQQIGMIMVLSLMVLTFYVDINRYFMDKIRSLF